MAYIKILRNRNVLALEEYLFKGRDADDPIELNGCSEGLVSEQFIGTQMHFGAKHFFDAIHVIQGFKDSDSSKLSPEEYPVLAKKMVEELFPGHEFCVVTHTDEDHIHNHIMINPVNAETGKRIHDKKHVLYDLRAKSDELCIEKGLSIIENQSKERWKKTPEKIKDQHKRSGFSWVLDLKEKADFARSIATSFDEYAGVLNQFNIKVRVENKNISYIYPDRKAKRDDAYALGKKYSKSGLKETFRENYKNFSSAGLKKRPIEEIDFSDYWVIHRNSKNLFVPEHRYSDLVIPKDLIKFVQSIDIEKYATEQGIRFSLDKDGLKCLEHREHVKLRDNRWINEKTKARGGAFEFINYCHKESWLETLKRFDSTDKVKKVKNIVEEKTPSFKAFYAPTPYRETSGKEKVSFSNHFSELSNVMSSLSKIGKIKITRSGRLKFVPQDNPNSSITFYRQKTGWVTRSSKGLRQPFISMVKSMNNPLLIFEDPISFLSTGKILDRIVKKGSRLNIIVPLKPVDEFLKENEKEFRKYPKVRIAKTRESLFWGPEGEEKTIENAQRIILEKELGIKFGSIEELLKELILGRTL